MCMCVKAEEHLAELGLALSYKSAQSGLWASKSKFSLPQVPFLSEADQAPGALHPAVTPWDRPFGDRKYVNLPGRARVIDLRALPPPPKAPKVPEYAQDTRWQCLSLRPLAGEVCYLEGSRRVDNFRGNSSSAGRSFRAQKSSGLTKADSPSCSCPSPEEVEEEETSQQGLVQNRAWTAAPQVHRGIHSSCQSGQGQFYRSLWLWRGPSCTVVISPVTKGCHTCRASSGPWLVHLWNG